VGKGYGPPRGRGVDPYADGHGPNGYTSSGYSRSGSRSSGSYRNRGLLTVADDVSIETKQRVVSDSILEPNA
jgi:hypothetical protein